ncbi:hypothetical protein ACFLZS_00540 [Patescibacteria group bacterium]
MDYQGWLYYLTPEHCKIVTGEGKEIDLCPIIEDFLSSIDGKKTSHEEGKDYYALRVDPDSEFTYYHDSDKENKRIKGLNKTSGTGWSNVNAYLENAMTWIDGRLVNFEISEDQLRIEADPSEEVFGVYFTGEGASCAVSEENAKNICGFGGEDTCVFLSMETDQDGTSFVCDKFYSYLARILLRRLAEGSTKAKRIGNCALLGREEEPVSQTAEV